MKYLKSYYEKLLQYNIPDTYNGYQLVNSLKCDQIQMLLEYSYENIKKFKTTEFLELKGNIYSKNSFILHNIDSFIAFRIISEYNQKRLYIYEFHVKQELHNKNYGSLLLQLITLITQFLKINYIALTVDVQNIQGVQFWQKHQFVPAKESPQGESYIILIKKI